MFGLSARYSIGGWGSEYENGNGTQDKVRRYTRELNLQVNGFYVVTIASPKSRKEDKVKLEIVDGNGVRRKDVAFTYQRRLAGRAAP